MENFQWQSNQPLALIDLQHWLSQLDAAKEQEIPHIYQYFAHFHGRKVLNAQHCAAIRLQQGRNRQCQLRISESKYSLFLLSSSPMFLHQLDLQWCLKLC